MEPENRLVARELERRWEEALSQKRDVEEEYHRFQREQPEELTATQREAILCLCEDVAKIWDAATTSIQDRQEIIRLLLERVVVNVERDSEQVDVTLHWAGGSTSCHRLIRPVSRYEQLSNYPALRQRIDALHSQGRTSPRSPSNSTRRDFIRPSVRRSSPGTWWLAYSARGACMGHARGPWPSQSYWKSMNTG